MRQSGVGEKRIKSFSFILRGDKMIFLAHVKNDVRDLKLASG